MKKILFTLCLFVIMQNVFAKESYQTKYINHTLNIVSSWLPTTTYVLANIGDTVSLSVYQDQILASCFEWYFLPSNSTQYDSVPESLGVNPLSIVVTQYGSYITMTGTGNQFTIIPPVFPVKPGVITGQKTGICSSTQSSTLFEYSVPYVLGNSYYWTTPAGLSYIEGQGTNILRIRNTDSYFSGQLSVTASNILGTSPARTITIKSNPSGVAPISGPVSVCSGSTGNAYSIAPVFSALSYRWVGPAGSHISDGTTTSALNILTTPSTSVTVSFGTVTPTSVLKVRANNNCGSTLFRKLTLIPCSPRSASEEAETAAWHTINSVNIFPTAVNSSLTIELRSSASNDIEISFFDITGKQFKTGLYKNVSGEFIKNENTEALARGIYFVRIKAGDEVIQKKFIKM